jgi:hypothetical protein
MLVQRIVGDKFSLFLGHIEFKGHPIVISCVVFALSETINKLCRRHEELNHGVSAQHPFKLKAFSSIQTSYVIFFVTNSLCLYASK